ncbi:MAG: thermonuclease family protein [Candidatus Nitrosocaldus sp.]
MHNKGGVVKASGIVGMVSMLLLLLQSPSPLLQESSSMSINTYDIIILEHHHPDAEYVRISVVDGDTVRLLDKKESLRLVGYNAYELREPLGNDAKAYLQRLCSDGHAYMLIDTLEPRDRYGRLLGYLWCNIKMDDYTAWVSVQRAFLASNLIKNELYIKPDLYPYWVWRESKEIRFEGHSSRMIGKVTVVGSDGVKVYESVTSVSVPAGVYRVCLSSGDSCTLVNLLDDATTTGASSIDVDRLANYTRSDLINVSSVEGRSMAFIHAEMPLLHVGSIRVVADADSYDGFMARVKVVTEDGRIVTSVVRDSSKQVHIDAKAFLIKIYMVKKDSREVCIDGLPTTYRIMLNSVSVDRPCIRFYR